VSSPVKSLLENEYVVTLLCAAALWIGKKVIEKVTVKWPMLKKLKLQEKLERVIDKVKEAKIAAKKNGKELTVEEINHKVDLYSADEKVNPTEVKLHRRRLKRAATGHSLDYGVGFTPGSAPTFNVGGKFNF